MSARDIWDELLGHRWTTLEKWRQSGRSESLHIDFKEGALDTSSRDLRESDRKNLAKGLSGFANTEGGVLLFGATTARGPEKADRLVGLPGIAQLTRYAERIRAHVAGITTPTIPAVVVEAIEDPTRANTGLVAIFVPLSDALPFRAEGPTEVSGRYFIRTTTDTTVMPHQVLAAMFGRQPHPRLRLGLARENVRKVRLFVENAGRGAAALPLVRVHVHRGGDIDSFRCDAREPWRDRRGDVYLAGHGAVWQVAIALPPDQRIYPGETRFCATLDFLRDDPIIRARIDCDGAPPTEIDERVHLTDAVTWLDGTRR